MIERANIKGSKSNVAMNAWLSQASSDLSACSENTLNHLLLSMMTASSQVNVAHTLGSAISLKQKELNSSLCERCTVQLGVLSWEVLESQISCELPLFQWIITRSTQRTLHKGITSVPDTMNINKRSPQPGMLFALTSILKSSADHALQGCRAKETPDHGFIQSISVVTFLTPLASNFEGLKNQ